MQRSRAVSFIVHEPHALFLEDPNIGAIMLGANTVLSDTDLQMVTLVTDSARDVERVTRYLSGGFVDGVIIVSARANDPITRSIERAHLPAAFVGHPPDLETIPYVGIDNTASARAVTERLVATGRRRIGMIAAALDRDSGTDRLTGFRAALGDRYDPDLVVEVPLYEFNAGLHGTLELLRRASDVDGIFAASDAVAAGVLAGLRRSGRTVPDDVGHRRLRRLLLGPALLPAAVDRPPARRRPRRTRRRARRPAARGARTCRPAARSSAPPSCGGSRRRGGVALELSTDLVIAAQASASTPRFGRARRRT